MIARPGQHAVVRHRAGAEPVDVAAASLDPAGAYVRSVEHGHERRHVALATLDDDAGVVEPRGQRRRREKSAGHDAVHVPDDSSCRRSMSSVSERGDSYAP